MNLEGLSKNIVSLHQYFQNKAVAAVNVSLTLRNWIVGYYIVEYEQQGEDRANYGDKLIRTLAQKLKQEKLKGMSRSNLNVYRKLYLVYPQIIRAIPEQLSEGIIRTLPGLFEEQKIRTVSGQLQNPENTLANKENYLIPPEKSLTKLSFSHLEELIKIDDPLKRAFYEIECINGTWSTRELDRQISSLYFERSGLSKDKEGLSKLAQGKAEQMLPTDIVKNPLTFEFLDIPTRILLEEDALEQALIDNLHHFLLELGNGFCFEARQKRILIDDEYFYIDLVFYHRILKCHVLVELKTEKFTHENIGQLNAYLQYYKEEVMQKTDNPPIGILLCTKSKAKMVKYATADSEQLFVSEYRLQLPTEDEIQAYVASKINMG